MVGNLKSCAEYYNDADMAQPIPVERFKFNSAGSFSEYNDINRISDIMVGLKSCVEQYNDADTV
jgi:hypothetical protein